MQRRETEFTGRQGVPIRVQSWVPEVPVRASLVVAHGLGEHGGRYGELVARCTARGMVVYAPDHRGHGRSGGPRAQVGRFAWLVDDLDVVMEQAAREHAGAKRFLLGHSMGGAIALTWALDHPGRIDGLVLSAAAIAPPSAVPAATIALVRLLSRVWPGRGAIALSPADLSRDPAVVRAYEEDPLVLHGPVPARTLAELFGAMQSLPQRAPMLREPLLALHGTSDRLVGLDDVRPALEALGSRDKTLRSYPGLYHEVMNEPERGRVFADLEAWLDARL
jgi:lysophospholipase